jgi:hypothetical protein
MNLTGITPKTDFSIYTLLPSKLNARTVFCAEFNPLVINSVNAGSLNNSVSVSNVVGYIPALALFANVAIHSLPPHK